MRAIAETLQVRDPITVIREKGPVALVAINKALDLGNLTEESRSAYAQRSHAISAFLENKDFSLLRTSILRAGEEDRYARQMEGSLATMVNIQARELYRPLGEVEVDQLANAQRTYLEARNDIVTMNVGLVYNIAREKFNDWVPFEDRVQAGMEGLIQAADTYDYRRARFSTHAHILIYRAIVDFLDEQGNVIKIASRTTNRITRKARESLEQKLTREPTAKEIAKNSGGQISVETANAIELFKGGIVSLDRPVEGRDGTFYAATNMLVDRDENVYPEQVALAREAEREWSSVVGEVRSLLDDPQIVKPRERDLLVRWLGLNGEAKSQQELAEEEGLTKSRIAQLVGGAVRSLQQHLGVERAAPEKREPVVVFGKEILLPRQQKRVIEALLPSVGNGPILEGIVMRTVWEEEIKAGELTMKSAKRKLLDAFSNLQIKLKAHGIRIVNCTPGRNIESSYELQDVSL